MKYINYYVLAYISLFSLPALACQIQVPESEAQRYITAAPNGVPPLYSCSDKPKEACLCADDVEDWEVMELVDHKVKDIDGKFKPSKKLVVSEAKKAIEDAEDEAEDEAKKIKQDKKKGARKKIEEATTIKALKDAMLDYID